MNKKGILILFLVVVLLFYFVYNINTNKLKNEISRQGYQIERLIRITSLSFEEYENATNCSMDKFPRYLTVNDLSKSDLDDSSTFWIMHVWDDDWECEPRDDYGEYNRAWCNCKLRIK